MKKIYLLVSLLTLINCATNAQNGLENVIVEKYYVSDANDSNADTDGGILPVGSVTYRIYADMLQGYKFQAAYGVPDHELRIETTTLFWNNEDRGATSPTFTKVQAAKNTVMLDSWLSVGAACNGQYGIMKIYDDGNANVINNYSPMVLQNNDPAAGIPLTTQDGFIAGTPEPVTAVGISNEITVFDNQNDGTNGPVFSTYNGSWASLNGSFGPDTIDNKVLIAQITTDGVLSFKLNIQIGTPTGGVENYVADNPIGTEVQMASLTYSSTTGVQSHSVKNSNVSIYPNPSSDFSYLRLSNLNNAEVSYKVVDLTGKVLVQKNIGFVSGNINEQMDISSLSSGLYLVIANVDGVQTTQKLVKK
ncbi:MAG TPA: T9SS type A sorting domain-containing protein [Bacteroidia bacterium]|jgi:hypothetical protein|nr:T9SS type A sorting domain-containing protein [Bacteroidia bacterium]HQF26993.1 T9SS type A sorting domain-containing protein [Bacteroidia bacterium]HQK96416.1 T9SS type A sorting domain-containing protein [Bacteroidia bacterium]